MSARAYIPYGERLAATLACLVPQAQRDQLRADKVGSAFVIALFAFDHIDFHANGGSDLWWNLDPKLIAEHRAKTAKIDIPAIAKGARIRENLAEFNRRIAAKDAGEVIAPRRRQWPSRPFPRKAKR